MSEKRFTNATGAPVADNTNILTAGGRLLQDQCRRSSGQSDAVRVPENFDRH
jgi:hypothetical protein